MVGVRVLVIQLELQMAAAFVQFAQLLPVVQLLNQDFLFQIRAEWVRVQIVEGLIDLHVDTVAALRSTRLKRLLFGIIVSWLIGFQFDGFMFLEGGIYNLRALDHLQDLIWLFLLDVSRLFLIIFGGGVLDLINCHQIFLLNIVYWIFNCWLVYGWVGLGELGWVVAVETLVVFFVACLGELAVKFLLAVKVSQIIFDFPLRLWAMLFLITSLLQQRLSSVMFVQPKNTNLSKVLQLVTHRFNSLGLWLFLKLNDDLRSLGVQTLF